MLEECGKLLEGFEKTVGRLKVPAGISAKIKIYINLAEYFIGYLHAFKQGREFLLFPLIFSQDSARKIQRKAG